MMCSAGTRSVVNDRICCKYLIALQERRPTIKSTTSTGMMVFTFRAKSFTTFVRCILTFVSHESVMARFTHSLTLGGDPGGFSVHKLMFYLLELLSENRGFESALASISVVNQHWARLVLGRVTAWVMAGFKAGCAHLCRVAGNTV